MPNEQQSELLSQRELVIRKEMVFLWMAVGIIVLMCLFPPWEVIRKGHRYGWLFSRDRQLLDVPRLVVQCAFVALLAGAAIYTNRICSKK